MGINNDTVLVYGWIFSYDEFVDKLEKLMGDEFSELDNDFDLLVQFKIYFVDESQEFTVGESSAYYDSNPLDKTYYISFKFENVDDLYKLIKYDRTFGLVHNYKLLKMMEITSRAELYSLPDVN